MMAWPWSFHRFGVFMAKKLQLGYKDIEAQLQTLKNGEVAAAEVGYEILKAFGKSDIDVARYKAGKGVLTKFDGLLIKGLFCYRATTTVRLTEELERLKTDELVRKATPKIIAVSDGDTVLAWDTRERDTYEQKLHKMHSDFGFFYPLMNVERVHNEEESPADVKAAEKLAKLHDEIRAYNEYNSDDDLHDLNIFITRLLFCFFAEDTGIFEENLFTGFIRQFTKDDGSDLSELIGAAFRVMNIRTSDRSEDTPKEINAFPYVNGGLFATDIPIPRMGRKARKIVIESGELDWKDINPDIFGSMIQAVVNPDVRAKEGMHYTSVPNIMKVINPLFMDDLRAEYKKLTDFYDQKRNLYDLSALSYNQFVSECKPIIKGCNRLLGRMSKMKFFDPACGSGNFLIITYKQLRLLEMDILRLRKKCAPEQMLDFIDGSCIRLDQFYGIELLDFPHEVAMLSLWLAEHQMNNKFHADFGVNVDALPLKNINQIKCGNACRLDWEVVCPHDKEEEVFVFGNPPYLGSKLQTKEQKEDLALVCASNKRYKDLDYICNWFVKGRDFISGTVARLAFVSTNSITQGEQIPMFWPMIFERNIEIGFVHKSFKWSNNAKNTAGVSCVVIGLETCCNRPKHIYDDTSVQEVAMINPYLTAGSSVIVEGSFEPMQGFPLMEVKNMTYDGGFLVFDELEKDKMIKLEPEVAQYIIRLQSGSDFIEGKCRYTFWIEDADVEKAMQYSAIRNRVDKVKEYREKSGDVAKSLARFAYQFRFPKRAKDHFIMIPIVTSERREYLPIGVLDNDTITTNAAYGIYDSPLWILGILETKLHMLWVKKLCGRLETRIRYSSSICYNTFPFPSISEAKKSEIEEAATEVLLARENYPDKTLADLYDPDKMPEDLRAAHEKLDSIVESCYPGAPFANDEARLECLFNLYEKMTAKKRQ